MNYDYIQVGLGIVGSFFNLKLLHNNKSVLVFDKGLQSSYAAAGVVNIVNLNNFKILYNANVLLEVLDQNREIARIQLRKEYYQSKPLYKVFIDSSDLDLWFNNSTKSESESFISDEIFSSSVVENNLLRDEKKLGRVFQSGKWLVEDFVNDIRSNLSETNSMNESIFDFDKLEYKEGFWHYENIKAKRIVFTDGYKVSQNPYFSYLPIHLIKGQAIIFSSNSSRLQNMYKSKYFLIPFSDSRVYFGGSHQRNQNDFVVDNEIQENIDSELAMYNFDISKEEQRVGLRPCVKDYKPIFGEHPIHKNMYIINGVAGRGVLWGSYGASLLYDSIEKDVPIPKVYNVRRFDNLL